MEPWKEFEDKLSISNENRSATDGGNGPSSPKETRESTFKLGKWENVENKESVEVLSGNEGECWRTSPTMWSWVMLSS